MAGLDSNVKLLLHCDGADASTTFTDSSDSAHTVNPQGDVQVDTAQSVFGGASALFDNTGDYLSVPDSADWDLGTDDFAIDCRVRLADTGQNTICARVTSGSSYFYFTFELTTLRFRDYIGSNNVDIQRSLSVTTGVWYHIAVTRSGNDWRIFLDGVQQGATVSSSATMTDRSVALDVGHMTQNAGYAFNGHIDEFRFSKGDARWTSDFTPPTEAYSSGEQENLEITVASSATVSDTQSYVEDNSFTIVGDVSVLDEVFTGADDEPLEFTIVSSITEEDVADYIEDLSFTIQSSITVVDAQPGGPAHYGTKILSINPLIFVTNTDPAKVVKVDTTDPENITWETANITGVSNVVDASLNADTGYIYAAGAGGLVAKIEVANISNFSIIDLSDVDDLLKTETFDDFGISYASTENGVGELYLIDERSTFVGDSNLEVLAEITFVGDTSFNSIIGFIGDCDMQLLATSTFIGNCDFKCTKSVTPIALSDYRIFIDGTELTNKDLILSSIQITHTVDEKSLATFILNRKHDKIDYDVDGGLVQITNQNDVRIEIDGNIEFPKNGEGTAKIASLDCQYNLQEQIVVTAKASVPSYRYNNITLSLPSLDQRLGLNDVLIETPRIDNEYIDADELNPRKYKGIFVPLGKKITQTVQRYIDNDTTGSFAEGIQDGSKKPRQNWNYFWQPIVKRFGNYSISTSASTSQPEDDVPFHGIRLPVFKFGGVTPFDNIATGDTTAIYFEYIGTSLSPIGEDLWYLSNARHRRQRIYPDIITRLGVGKIRSIDLEEAGVVNASTVFSSLISTGYIDSNGNIQNKFKNNVFEPDELLISYTKSIKNIVYDLLDEAFGYYVGEAPFKRISSKNGIFIPQERYSDEDNGLYRVLDEGYNYEEFAKKVADLEYQKLLNINGDIQPETSTSMTLTIDGYYYHGIRLLNRINVDNTTQDGIFKNANGFPLGIKSVTITSADRKVNITADNIKSTPELEAIDGLFPNEEDDQYKSRSRRTLQALKTDMNTRLKIE